MSITISEAIRRGVQIRPLQAFHRYYNGLASCAFGAAIDGLFGVPYADPGGAAVLPKAWAAAVLPKAWAGVLTYIQGRACPLCDKATGSNMIMHLNDEHRQSREAIAAWIETVEWDMAAQGWIRITPDKEMEMASKWWSPLPMSVCLIGATTSTPEPEPDPEPVPETVPVVPVPVPEEEEELQLC